MRGRGRLPEAPGAAGRLRLLAASALLALPLGALGQPGIVSLFTAEARAPGPQALGRRDAEITADDLEAVRHSRIAQADLARLGALRESVESGRPGKLRLNLLHGVEHLATVERSVPTASGYTLSGPLDEVPFGRAVLVVNGATVMGRVYTPQGNWTIRTADSMQVVEPMQREPWRCGLEEPADAERSSDGAARPLDAHPTHHAQGATKLAPWGADAEGRPGPQPRRPAGSTRKSAAADDGDVVDVLVVYPSFVREIEGGYGPMLALIDLDIATANEAYAASGVALRVELAAAVEVEYDWFLETNLAGNFGVSSLWGPALKHLSESGDGHLDEVHALRDRHAADLVLLHLGGEPYGAILGIGIAGIARVIYNVTDEVLERLGFSVARSGDGTTVAHELGHTMGLHHERRDGTRNEPFPYSHGFSFNYRKDVLGEVRRGAIWQGTVMSRDGWAHDDGHVLAFSNPELGHPENPDLKLGVPGDEPSFESDGPADATRHLNELRHVIANVRARADADPCRYALSGDDDELPAEGGTYRLRVETGADCGWTASAGEWVESVSPAGGTGSGEIEVAVGGNANWGRPAEVLVAGRLHKRHQAGSRPITPLCERTIWGRIADKLEELHPENDYSQWGCSTYTQRGLFNEENLAAIRTFRRPADIGPSYDGLDASRQWGLRPDERGFRPGDFDGLTGLVDLKIHSMEHLPPDLLSGLVGLRVLEIEKRLVQDDEKPTLTTIAPGAFRGLPGVKRLALRWTRLGRLDPGTFEGLPGLIEMVITSIGEGQLALEPGVFDGLTDLRYLDLPGNGLRRLEPGVFDGLGELTGLVLEYNSLGTLPVGVFDGLPELQSLRMWDNRMAALPAGLFDGLPNLERLDVGGNRISRIDSDAFRGLPSLKDLTLRQNRLTAIEPGWFGSLRSLERLDLHSNQLATLEPGSFPGLPSLTELSLSNNRLRNLQPGTFEGLEFLSELFLRWNRLGGIRAGAFRGLDRLYRLYLNGADVTSLAPGVFDDTPRLEVLDLEKNRLRGIAPGTFRGVRLRGLHLGGNPGAPLAFAPSPVVHPAWDPAAGGPAEAAVEVLPEAPFPVDAALEASGGSLSVPEVHVPPGRALGDTPVIVTPDRDEPVTVRVGQARWPEDSTISVFYGYGYSGFRVTPGPPLVLQGIADRALALGRGPEAIDLAGAFPPSLGPADYAAESSDGTVAAVSVEDGALVVSPRGAGSATVTVTATAADGGTLTREFRVTVRAPSVPLFLSGSNPQREGFMRLINRSERVGDVRITAFDDGGARFGPVDLRLRANGAVHFNSGDLEDGNAAKGLAEGIGVGQGDWRLEFETDLDIVSIPIENSPEVPK